MVIGSWLSNLAVPGFFAMAGFLLFRKMENGRTAKDKTIIRQYCWHIAKMTLIWSVLYLPIEGLNWANTGITLKEWAQYYIQHFFFSHPIAHLWFLPALLTACLLVWLCYFAGMKPWQILTAGWILFCIGYIGDNSHYFSLYLPSTVLRLFELYSRYFLTMRNGVFYGTWFVAIGLWLAKSKRQIRFWPSVSGFLISVFLMYLEVKRIGNTNMVMFSAPAAFFLVSAAMDIPLKDRKLYTRLRGLSQWIYLSHFYFIYLFSCTVPWNPLPLTKKGIMVSVFAPLTVFCIFMVWLSEKKEFSWLKKLV